MASLVTPRYLKIHDIQAMLAYIFTGQKRPHFIQLKKKPASVWVVKVGKEDRKDERYRNSDLYEMLPGDTSSHVQGRASENQIYRHQAVGSSGPCAAVEDALEALQINMQVHLNENTNLDFVYRNLLKSTSVSRIDLGCITEESIQMIEKHDITHLFSYSTFVKSQTVFDEKVFETFIRPTKTTQHFIIAIDCEMMLTPEGPQIGRLTMVDCRGTVVYDTYVKPSTCVTDYLERYSGLNCHNTARGIPFGRLQEDILEYIGTNTYVLGHGLENDLAAIKFYTDRIIDTAYLFLSTEGYKVKLSQLSRKHIRESIQEGTHSSREDALCCLKLLAYKISQLQSLLSPDTELLNLHADVQYVKGISPASECSGRRSLVFLEVDKLLAEDFRDCTDPFLIFLYKRDDMNYVAFRQEPGRKLIN